MSAELSEQLRIQLPARGAAHVIEQRHDAAPTALADPGRHHVASKKATFILTPSCNLQCKYCFQRGPGANNSYRAHSRSGVASQEVIRHFAEFCSREGIDEVDFFGGEPLMYEDAFVCATRALSERNVRAGLVTNGTLITERVMRVIEDRDMPMLLSLDGAKERHNSMRGGFEAVSRWFERLSRRSNLTVAVQAGVVSGLCESIRYIWGLGFKHVYVNILDAYTWYRQGDVDVFEQEYEAAVLRMIAGDGVLVCATQLMEMLNSQKHIQGCGIVNSGLACDWRGRLFPCQRAMELGDLLIIGDVTRGVDPEASRAAREAIRKQWLASPSVRRFPLVSFCAITAFQRNNTFDGPWSEMFCELINAKAKVIAKHRYALAQWNQKPPDAAGRET